MYNLLHLYLINSKQILFISSFCAIFIHGFRPSLNTQSYIIGLLVVRDFRFWFVWAARPILKISLILEFDDMWINS